MAVNQDEIWGFSLLCSHLPGMLSMLADQNPPARILPRVTHPIAGSSTSQAQSLIPSSPHSCHLPNFPTNACHLSTGGPVSQGCVPLPQSVVPTVTLWDPHSQARGCPING